MDRLVLFRERSGPITVFYVAILIQKIRSRAETIRLLVIPDRCGSIEFRKKSIWIDKGSLSVGMESLKVFLRIDMGRGRLASRLIWADKGFIRIGLGR